MCAGGRLFGCWFRRSKRRDARRQRGADSGAGGTDASSSAAGIASLIGTFQVTIADADPESGREPYTGVLGVVYDRQPPMDGVIFEVDQERGECQLLVPAVPFCEPGCGVDAVCTDDDVCTPYATGQNLGAIDVEGLLPGDFTMEPIAPTYKYQPSGDVHFPYPPCTEGDPIRVIAQDADMHIESRCVAPLVLGGPDTIVVKARQAVALTWTPPRARIEAGSRSSWTSHTTAAPRVRSVATCPTTARSRFRKSW